ncbi:hypothetical protein AB5J62_26090 [Amycolatopsis sp. cg5]|uniref:hypothetical protein n=1 Tax=Amycolatopsis sp. cg5 TaxID=3238802 RepID=UPI0035255333
MTDRHTSDPQPTIPRQSRKGSDHDSDHHDRTDHAGHGDHGSPDSDTGDDAHRNCQEGPERADSVPSRRAGQITPARQGEPVSATVKTGPDGSVWVFVGGADAEEFLDRLTVVADALNSMWQTQ